MSFSDTASGQDTCPPVAGSASCPALAMERQCVSVCLSGADGKQTERERESQSDLVWMPVMGHE